MLVLQVGIAIGKCGFHKDASSCAVVVGRPADAVDRRFELLKNFILHAGSERGERANGRERSDA